MTEMDLWMLLAAFSAVNGVYFLACVIAIWLGFRISNGIASSDNVPMLARVLGTTYCLAVAFFTLANFGQSAGVSTDVAEGFMTLSQTTEISSAATKFMTLEGMGVIKLAQGIFLLSVVLFQIAGIWSSKPEDSNSP